MHLRRLALSGAASACLVLTAATLASAQPPVLRIPRVDAPPVLERYLDGTTTPPGARVSGFKQREPGDGADSVVETDVYVSFDDKHLYAVFICRDDPARIRANLTRREAINDDDRVGLLLDTYRDGRRSYLLLSNPLGIQGDGITTEGQGDDYSFDALWSSDGRVTSFGYVVVMAVPFKSLRFSGEAQQVWGVAFGRVVPRANEVSFWPYITRRISAMGPQLARLEGLHGISPGRNLSVIPYGNFAADRVLGDGGYVSDQAARVGVDAKAVIRDTVTVDATLNPDFSQVESDEPQVTINQRFEVYYPEKRPFFIENAGYFETPQNLFFSRRLADPRLGARVTGRAAGWTFGALVANDEAPGRRVAAGDARHGRLAGIAVVRVQREFAGQNHLGAIVTDREWGDSANRVAGADGRWRIGPNWAVTGQAVASRTVSQTGGSVDGTLVQAELEREGRGFDFQAQYLQVSPDFRTDVGFVRRRDIRRADAEVDYTWHPTGRRVLSAGVNLEGGAIWDFAGTLQEWTIEPGFEVELPGQTEIGLRHWNIFERFEGVDFRRHNTMAYASTQWLSWLAIEGRVEAGTDINYYPAPGLAPFLADAVGAEVGVTLRPSTRLRLDQSYLYSRLSTSDGGSGCACAPRGDVFTNHILRTRANLQFSRPLSLRAIVDYEAISPDRALVDLDREKRFGLDVLATYLVNPWTAVYVGYTDTYENWELGAPGRRPVGRSDAATTSVGRQIFIKLSYLFRY